MALIDGADYKFGVMKIRPGAVFESQRGAGFGTADPSHSVLAVDSAGHVVAGNPMQRICCVVVDVAHPNASAVWLSNVIDEKVGEKSVSVDHVSGRDCQQYAFEVLE